VSRIKPFVVAVAGFAVATGLLGGAATASPLSVKLVEVGQKQIRSKGVTVEVRSSRKGKVTVALKVKSFDEGTLSAGRKTVSFRKKGTRKTTIGLNRKARQLAGNCQKLGLSVTATGGGRKASRSKGMVRNLGPCRLAKVNLSRASHCDFIAQPKQGRCMMPFPNDFHTRRDSSSPTGKRINFDNRAMPRNNSDKVIKASDYNYSDGFSQGQGIVLRVPGVDSVAAIKKNNFVELDRLSRYAEPSQKAVVIDAKTGKRWPIWVQVDSNAGSNQNRALMISPSTNFDPKGRYIVALRNLVDANGKAVTAPDAFRYYRDQIPSKQKPVNDRRSKFEGIFKTLKKAGIKRSSLYLAWDFTVASNENSYARALHMRDEAFKELGDTTMADGEVQGDAPEFVVTAQGAAGDSLRLPDNSVRTIPNDVARYVAGTYTVPCFLTGGSRAGQPDECGSGGTMDLNADGLPKRYGDYEANFECIIPQTAFGPEGVPGRPHVYGHGLLGASAEIVFSPVSRGLGRDHGMVGCATDEIGMAAQDLLATVIPSLTELSNFPKLADRLQQGLLNELFLARVMFHPEGFVSDPAFQDGDGVASGDPVIDTDDVFYTGASQGGIMGGALTAISPDFTKAALVVGGMNYSTLLNRSSNWGTYGLVFNNAYGDELERPLVLNIIQMLWDRGEPNGYAHVMTDNPPPNTPPHEITLQIALGDHQVSNFTSDVQARTVGAKTNIGAIDDRRWPNYEDLWNIERIKADEYPYRGSSIIYWDSGPPRPNPDNPSRTIGTGVSPYENIAPNAVDDSWEDPHGAPRGGEVGPVSMMATFLQTDGYIEDLCNGLACVGGGWDGFGPPDGP
jgi:hypothetical protein